MFYDKYVLKLIVKVFVNLLNIATMVWDFQNSMSKPEPTPVYYKLAYLKNITYYSITIYLLYDLIIHFIFIRDPKGLCEHYSSYFYKEHFKFTFVQSNLVFLMYWSLFFFSSISDDGNEPPLVLNIYKHGVITLILYMDIIFFNPHIMFNFSNKSASTPIKSIRLRKLYIDFLICLICVSAYIGIIVLFGMTVEVYPYPFTKQYNLFFWILMVANLLSTWALYMWYRFLSYRLLKLNARKECEENMSNLLFGYINDYEGYSSLGLREDLSENSLQKINDV